MLDDLAGDLQRLKLGNPEQHHTAAIPRCLLDQLPMEILLQIMSSVNEIMDVLSLRMTCSRLYQVTQDKSLWLDQIQNPQRLLPLPSNCSDGAIRAMSSRELEELVLWTNHVDRTWLLPRSIPLEPRLIHKLSVERALGIPMSASKTILAIQVFSERWLLCVYQEMVVELWDVHPELDDGIVPKEKKGNALASRYLDAPLEGVSLCSSCIITLNGGGDSLILAATFTDELGIFQIDLPKKSADGPWLPATLKRVALLPLPSVMQLVRAVYPVQNLAVVFHEDTLILIDWKTNRRWHVTTSDEYEELWNGVVTARFITPSHILCMRVHSVVLFVLPPVLPVHRRGETTISMQAQVLSHRFGNTTFRNVSFSEPHIEPQMNTAPDEWSITSAEISFLAFDIIRGLFHYHVTLTLPIPPSSPSSHYVHPLDAPIHPQMSVRLIAAHHMAVPVDRAPGSSARLRRSGMTPGSKGFVTSCVLGTTGRRGVWVERRKGSVRREVIGFAAAQDAFGNAEDMPGQREDTTPPAEGGNEEGSGELEAWWENPSARAIDGHVVFEVNSYDLRAADRMAADDVTHCAFAEATGRIVLGTRAGRIQVLR